MAGIGFELRKLIEERSVKGFLGAAFSGTFIVAGPWIVSMASVAVVQRLPFLAAGDAEFAFTGAMVWAFAISLCLGTGPLYAYVRLSADFIYERKRAEAGAALLKSAAVSAAAFLALGAGLSFVLVREGPHLALFRVSFALLLAALGALWLAMMTATVLRRYGRILASYGAGMALLVALAVFLGPRYGAAGGVAALAAGYGLAAALLVASALQALGRKSLPGFGKLMRGYLGRYRNLVIAGAAYSLGTWADKIILWYARGAAAEGTSFRIFPPYDSAFFYANLSLIPGLVYFTLSTETDFHLHLRRFLVFLGRRRQGEVEEARRDLSRNTRLSLAGQSLFQGGVVLISLILAGPLAEFLNLVKPSFELLTIAGLFQLLFLAGLNMLFYLELYRDAAWISILFLGLNCGLSLAQALGAPLPYGLPFIIAFGLSSALAMILVFRGLGRLDRIIYLRASGEKFGW